MASATKKTRSIRRRKRATFGKVRKRGLRREGSTKSAAELFGDEPPKK